MQYHVTEVPCTDRASTFCMKKTHHRMTDSQFQSFQEGKWLPDDAVCDMCALENVKITVPCQDGTDPNCHGELEMFVTASQANAWNDNDEIPTGAICPACGSDQTTCRDD